MPALTISGPIGTTKYYNQKPQTPYDYFLNGKGGYGKRPIGAIPASEYEAGLTKGSESTQLEDLSRLSETPEYQAYLRDFSKDAADARAKGYEIDPMPPSMYFARHPRGTTPGSYVSENNPYMAGSYTSVPPRGNPIPSDWMQQLATKGSATGGGDTKGTEMSSYISADAPEGPLLSWAGMSEEDKQLMRQYWGKSASDMVAWANSNPNLKGWDMTMVRRRLENAAKYNPDGTLKTTSSAGNVSAAMNPYGPTPGRDYGLPGERHDPEFGWVPWDQPPTGMTREQWLAKRNFLMDQAKSNPSVPISYEEWLKSNPPKPSANTYLPGSGQTWMERYVNNPNFRFPKVDTSGTPTYGDERVSYEPPNKTPITSTTPYANLTSPQNPASAVSGANISSNVPNLGTQSTSPATSPFGLAGSGTTRRKTNANKYFNQDWFRTKAIV